MNKKENSYLILDIESDSLDIYNTNIFCICALDYQTDEVFVFKNTDKDFIENAFELCSKYDYIVAHNGVRFDFLVLKKYGFKHKVRDTLIDSKMVFPKTLLLERDIKKNDVPSKLLGSYSLKAFGIRLGNYKQQFDDFTKLTDEMIEYCIQDCRVTKDLFTKIQESKVLPPYDILYSEYAVSYLLYMQELYGFYVDIDSLLKLKLKLINERNNINSKLQELYPPKLVKDGENLNPKLMKRNGFKICGPYSKLKLQTFNPGSRHQIVDRLKNVWKPEIFTEKLTPVVNEETIKDVPNSEDLSRYLKVCKDLSQLSEGKGSILNCYNEKTHRIHGKVDTLGAITHRMTHTAINMTQIPKSREFRECFTIPKGKVLIGIDVDSLELAMFGYYLEKFGNKEYAHSVAVGSKAEGNDVHTRTQKLVGLPTRDDAKRFVYGVLYGIGNLKLGYNIYPRNYELSYTKEEYSKQELFLKSKLIKDKYISLGSNQIVEYSDKFVLMSIYAQRAKNKFLNGTEGLLDLLEDLNNQFKSNKGFIRSIDGRHIFCNSSHKALNVLLQSSGGIIMKYSLLDFYNQMKLKGLKLNKEYSNVANIHDALVFETYPEYREVICKTVMESFTLASNRFNMTYPIKGYPIIHNNLYDIFVDEKEKRTYFKFDDY
ncbi:TPA: DNA polymerase [Campylobacter coli]